MGKRILIVDDDVELCQEVAEVLSDESFYVKTCHSPEECAELINSESFDIALVDFKMPGLSGIELVKKIKQKSPATKTLIISGKPFIEKLKEDESVSHLIDGVMNKPFDIAKLIQTLRSL